MKRNMASKARRSKYRQALECASVILACGTSDIPPRFRDERSARTILADFGITVKWKKGKRI